MKNTKASAPTEWLVGEPFNESALAYGAILVRALVAGIVSFVSAFVAGMGGRLLGSGHLEIAMMAAVLLLVPGVAVLNAQLDAIDGKPNLAVARGLRIAYCFS
jgi:uncharacterized membrane protein YjjP (DUF1212 family)